MSENAVKGEFQGQVVALWLDDGRKMVLQQPFAYLDPAGKLWKVPAPWTVDGATIPSSFWSSVGSPFVGKYRKASVVHDYYCDVRTESWRGTHKMFYHACRTGGVRWLKAKVMYAAVMIGGPKWPRPKGALGPDTQFRAASLTELRQFLDWIEQQDPKIEEIDHRLEQDFGD